MIPRLHRIFKDDRPVLSCSISFSTDGVYDSEEDNFCVYYTKTTPSSATPADVYEAVVFREYEKQTFPKCKLWSLEMTDKELVARAIERYVYFFVCFY